MTAEQPKITSTTESVDGTEVRMTRKPGAPLMMLSRMAAEAGIWDPVWRDLAHRFTIATFDVGGAARLDANLVPRERFQALAALMVRVASGLGFPRFHLFGWYGGAHIALSALLDHARHIETCPLLDPSGPRRQHAAPARRPRREPWDPARIDEATTPHAALDRGDKRTPGNTISEPCCHPEVCDGPASTEMVGTRQCRRRRPRPIGSIAAARVGDNGMEGKAVGSEEDLSTARRRAGLRLSFARSGELVALRQQAPLRAFFPRPSAGDSPEAVLANMSGGLVGGDRLDIRVDVGPDAAAIVTSQAAEKVYRSAGADVEMSVALTAGNDAWFEWLPQETILFDGSRLRRQIDFRIAGSARLLAADIIVFGREAHGETLQSGLFVDAWRLVRGGRLSWMDTLRLDGDVSTRLGAPFGFAGARAMATLIYAAPDADAWLGQVREMPTGTQQRRAATALPGVLLVRWLGDNPNALRRQVADLAAGLRHAIAGLPARLPTTWWT